MRRIPVQKIKESVEKKKTIIQKPNNNIDQIINKIRLI